MRVPGADAPRSGRNSIDDPRATQARPRRAAKSTCPDTAAPSVEAANVVPSSAPGMPWVTLTVLMQRPESRWLSPVPRSQRIERLLRDCAAPDAAGAAAHGASTAIVATIHRHVRESIRAGVSRTPEF